MPSELYAIAKKINNAINKIIQKADAGQELSIEQEEILKEIYICWHEDQLNSIKNLKTDKRTKTGKEVENDNDRSTDTEIIIPKNDKTKRDVEPRTENRNRRIGTSLQASRNNEKEIGTTPSKKPTVKRVVESKKRSRTKHRTKPRVISTPKGIKPRTPIGENSPIPKKKKRSKAKRSKFRSKGRTPKTKK